MKWMMCSVALMVAAVLPMSVGAQSGKIGKGDKTAKKEMKESTYTGCIEAGGTAGAFMLTHVAADQLENNVSKKGMKKDAKEPSSIALTSGSFDLSEHLGHKVSVTGSAPHGKIDATGNDRTARDAPGFVVKSLTMVAASCS